MAKEDVAMQVLQQVVKLPVVKVNRSKFLMDKFSKKVASKDIPRLLEEGPTALLPQETLDQVANACIKDNVLLASGTSVLAGLPGGIAMAVTIPTDVAQFYAFSLKLAQELGYIYGYDDLWASRDELSEDAWCNARSEWNCCSTSCWWCCDCQASYENSSSESFNKDTLVSNFEESFENFWG